MATSAVGGGRSERRHLEGGSTIYLVLFEALPVRAGASFAGRAWRVGR